MAFIFAVISCDDNDSIHEKDIVQPSTKEVTAQVDAEFSVEVSLANREAIHSILVKKTRSGQTAADFTTVTLDVENTVFPYTFTDVVKLKMRKVFLFILFTDWMPMAIRLMQPTFVKGGACRPETIIEIRLVTEIVYGERYGNDQWQLR